MASSSEDEDSGKGETRTVTTSLSAVLGLIKESAQEDNERVRHSVEKQMIGPEDPRMKKIPDTLTNPWDNLDTKSKASILIIIGEIIIYLIQGWKTPVFLED